MGMRHVPKLATLTWDAADRPPGAIARRLGIVLHEGRADEGRQRHAVPDAFFTASLTAALCDRTFFILDIGTPLLLGRNLCLRLFRCGAFSAA